MEDRDNLSEKDLVYVTLTGDEVFRAKGYATQAEIGGTSHVRLPGARTLFLPEDQLVGQLCTLAGHKYWFDDDLAAYAASREKANANPLAGDGGQDIPGLNVDFKGSLMRGKSSSPIDYRLAVRPDSKGRGVGRGEWKANWLYALATLDQKEYVNGVMFDKEVTVCLVGWAPTSLLPKVSEATGAFAGAYCVAGNRLLAMDKIKTSGLVRAVS